MAAPGQAWNGRVRLGRAGLGTRLGYARLGRDRLGSAWSEARPGVAEQRLARHAVAWSGLDCYKKETCYECTNYNQIRRGVCGYYG